jgi:AcrR family transcriptional regulator
MLQDALAQLLKEKEFDKISIGEIAQASTLNRATFYDHYPDKFALLQSLAATQFEELIVKRNIHFDSCEGALKSVAMAVCYYLAETIKPGSDALRQASTPMETAIVSVVRRGILDGFAKHPPKSGMPVEILSSTVAWAIYGAAKEWVQSPKRMPVPKIGETIEKIIMPILLS